MTRLGMTAPLFLAPMALVSGGRLAAAVTRAGGFGFIGGGYGDPGWLKREFDAAGDTLVGVGFITWALARQPDLLDLALRIVGDFEKDAVRVGDMTFEVGFRDDDIVMREKALLAGRRDRIARHYSGSSSP
ncbi:MAG: hypothetical protein Tsb008_02180 [Rhodothalassiaceae bacterium]